MGLILYKKDTSPPCRSVRMVLHALGITDVQLIDVNLPQKEHLKEEYIKINPQHTVPTLKDGDLIIWDSHAIATYLVTKYGKDDSLYPVDPASRAIVDQRLHFDSSVLFAALRSTVEPILYSGDKTYTAQNLDKIRSAYVFMEKFLTKLWLAGDHVTVADICCVSTISTMNEIVPIEKNIYPKLVGWLERCALEDFYKQENEPSLQKFREMMRAKLG